MVKKCSLLLFIFASAFASENFDIEDDFLQSLDSASQIATENKLNIDKTTSLITTIESKKLQKLGVKNIYEALKYIPGIELSKEASGVSSVIFRGSISKGEVKFMVDGVEINNAYRSSFYYYLDFPIELVSRIEVLRGSGSTLHGSGAISGVINIITEASQHTGNKVFLSTGSYEYGKGGAIVNISEPSFKLSADAYYQEDDKEIDSSDQRAKDYSAGVSIQAENIKFNARVKKNIQGNSYGLFGTIDTFNNKYENENQSLFSNLEYTASLSRNNDINIDINYAQYDQRIETFSQAIASIAGFSGDLVSSYKEEFYGSKFELSNTSIKNNTLLVGAQAKYNHSLKTDLWGYPGKLNIVTPNLKRELYSFYVKDNYLLREDINIDLGLRYDDYSDFGNNISANFGVVYRHSDQISVKLKHAHAFRAPSWTELYGLSGNSTLDAEVSDNTELGFVYRKNTYTRVSLNMYNSKLKDYIEQGLTNQYSQHSELNLRGVEFDLSYNPTYNLEIDYLASYTNAIDKDKRSVDGITKFLTTTSLIYTTEGNIIFGSTLRYKNTKNMDNNVIFDQSVSYSYKEFNIQLVGKNIFNSNVVYYDINHNKYNPIKDARRVVLLTTSWVF